MIYETNETFPLDRLTLLTPKPIPGGNHFSRFHIDDSPVFVQLPKCSTKQGIQLSGNKKAYTDLQFTNEQERFLKWMETLVEKAQDIVYENSRQWFANEMDKAEIEETFQSPLKPYRYGKIYLMRVTIPIRMGKIILPIFDEEETSVGADMVKSGCSFLGVLEVQGLKYSTKSIQLELEMKQLLLLPSLSLFDKCVLTTPYKSSTAPLAIKEAIVETSSSLPSSSSSSLIVDTQPLSEIESIEEKKEETTNHLDVSVPDITSLPLEETNGLPNPPLSEQESHKETETVLQTQEQTQEQIQEQTQTQEQTQEKEELQEVDICLENMTLQPVENIQLKNSKEIYYKMYRQARQKAKLARDLAISSYLESKHIKNVYVLEDLSDDEEIDFTFFRTAHNSR